MTDHKRAMELGRRIVALEKELVRKENPPGPAGVLSTVLLEDYNPDYSDVTEAAGMLRVWLGFIDRRELVSSGDWEERARQALHELDTFKKQLT